MLTGDMLAVLQDMIARYGMFLQLRHLAPQIFAVPPVDVDFIWHTHMSMSLQYHSMSMTHFGGLVSHETVSPEDSAKTVTRDTGFDGTQKAWAELFPGTPAACSILPALLKLNTCCMQLTFCSPTAASLWLLCSVLCHIYDWTCFSACILPGVYRLLLLLR